MSSARGTLDHWAALPAGRMHYLTAFPNSPDPQPALLLLHGLLGYSFSWRFNFSELSRHFRVYAPDSLGVGLSDRPVHLNCRMAAMASRFLQFMDSVGIDSADVVGTSHGGAIAAMMAVQAPHRIRRLVLAAPVNPWSRHGLPLIRLLSNPAAALSFKRAVFLLKPLHGFFLRRMYGDPGRIAPGTLQGYNMSLEIPGTLHALLGIVGSWHEDIAELRQVYSALNQHRTLLLWGERDAAVLRQSAYELQRRMPRSELVFLPTVGHLPYEEVPEEFNRVVLGFLLRN